MSALIGLTGAKRSGKNTVAEIMQPDPRAHVSFAAPLKKVLMDLNPLLQGARIHGSFNTTREQSRLLHALPEALLRHTSVHPAIIQGLIEKGAFEPLLDVLDPVLAPGLDRSPRVRDLISEPDDFEVYKEPGHVLDDELRRLLQILGTEVGRRGVQDRIWIDTGLAAIDELEGEVDRIIVTDVRFDDEALTILDRGGSIVRIHRPSTQQGAVDAHASERGVDPALVSTVLVNDGDLETLRSRALHVAQELS